MGLGPSEEFCTDVGDWALEGREVTSPFGTSSSMGMTQNPVVLSGLGEGECYHGNRAGRQLLSSPVGLGLLSVALNLLLIQVSCGQRGP